VKEISASATEVARIGRQGSEWEHFLQPPEMSSIFTEASSSEQDRNRLRINFAIRRNKAYNKRMNSIASSRWPGGCEAPGRSPEGVAWWFFTR